MQCVRLSIKIHNFYTQNLTTKHSQNVSADRRDASASIDAQLSQVKADSCSHLPIEIQRPINSLIKTEYLSLF